MCSRPMDRRTISGRTPTWARAAASSWRCVVDAGCATGDFASPIFTRRLNNLTVSKKRMLASYPPFGPKVNTDGKWSLRYRLARSW